MTPTTEPRLQAALEAAVQQIRATVTQVTARVADALGIQSQSSTRIAERDQLNAAQFELRRQAGNMQRVFDHELTTRAAQEFAPAASTRRSLATADWQTLSLVDDHEMEERMYADRIGQQITHACETELRDLAGYMGTLLQTGRAEQERNPLRGEIIGAALYRGIEAVTQESDLRKLLARELGAALAKQMPDCYQRILQGLQQRGLRPVELAVRQMEGPGYQLPGINSAYETSAAPAACMASSMQRLPRVAAMAATGPAAAASAAAAARAACRARAAPAAAAAIRVPARVQACATGRTPRAGCPACARA